MTELGQNKQTYTNADYVEPNPTQYQPIPLNSQAQEVSFKNVEPLYPNASEMRQLNDYLSKNYPYLLTINDVNSNILDEVKKENNPKFLVIRSLTEEDIHKVFL